MDPLPLNFINKIKGPQAQSTSEASKSVGESRKVWKNIMELKIKKTKTMTNMEKDKDKERQGQECRRINNNY